jgi:hypothetical protein
MVRFPPSKATWCWVVLGLAMLSACDGGPSTELNGTGAPADGTCVADLDCGPGLTCNSPSPGYCGQCAAHHEGDPCDEQWTCGDGLACVPDRDADPWGHCRAMEPGRLDARCYFTGPACAEGLACRVRACPTDEPCGNECRPAHAVTINGTCHESSECSIGLACLDKRCQARSSAGGKCSPEGLCARGFVCGAGSTCEVAPGLGSSCGVGSDPLGGDCLPGLYCEPTCERCGAGTCKTRPAGSCDRSACADAGQACAPRSNSCATPGPVSVGEHCNDEFPCRDGICDDGTCKQAAKLGASCGDPLVVCTPGARCTGGRCQVADAGACAKSGHALARE